MPQAADKLTKLLEKRNNALAECRKIKEAVDKNGEKGWTAEDRQTFDKWGTEAKEAKTAYDTELADQNRGQWLEEENENLDRPAGGRLTDPHSHGGDDPNKPKNRKDGRQVVTWNPYKDQPRFAKVHNRSIELTGPRAEEQYRQGFNKYLKGQSADKAFADPKNGSALYDSKVYNAIRSDDEESGGYLISSEQFMEGLLKNVDDRTFVQSLARVLVVREARSLGIRKRTAKVNSIQKGSELRDIQDSFDESLRFGKRVLTPYYFTGGIQVSRDWLRMSTLSGEAIVSDEMAVNMSEFNEQEFLYGNGQEGPLGIMVPSSEGLPTSRDIAVTAGEVGSGQAAATDFGFKTLTRAKFNQKLQYRNRSRWMFHRDSVAYINNITDANGQFIFQPSKQVGEPDRLLGLPMDESEWMPHTFTTGLYYGILACWEHYLIVYGLELEVERCNELASRTNQIEYHYRYKMDANIDLEEAFTRLKFG